MMLPELEAILEYEKVKDAAAGENRTDDDTES